MTKKEFIWLGIRAIGVYWLLKLIFTLSRLFWPLGSLLVQKDHAAVERAILMYVGSFLIQFPPQLVLTLYFLFGGTFIYKLISHFARTRPEDMSKPKGYCQCEIIIRFIGLWLAGSMLGKFYYAIATHLNSYSIYRILYSEQAQEHRMSFSTEELIMLLWVLPYLLLALFFAWYFLKKGNFFINLLNRLWLRKQ